MAVELIVVQVQKYKSRALNEFRWNGSAKTIVSEIQSF
jgi:hypothetical protein